MKKRVPDLSLTTTIATEEARSIVWVILPRLPIERGVCRVCECTEDHACMDGCAWVDKDKTLCTACCPPPKPKRVVRRLRSERPARRR